MGEKNFRSDFVDVLSSVVTEGIYAKIFIGPDDCIVPMGSGMAASISVVVNSVLFGSTL